MDPPASCWPRALDSSSGFLCERIGVKVISGIQRHLKPLGHLQKNIKDSEPAAIYHMQLVGINCPSMESSIGFSLAAAASPEIEEHLKCLEANLGSKQQQA